MKTYPLVLDDAIHTVIKHSAKISGESIKEFIIKSIKARLNIEDYIKTNKELQEDIKNWDTIYFMFLICRSTKGKITPENKPVRTIP